jgi:hypothetical protein
MKTSELLKRQRGLSLYTYQTFQIDIEGRYIDVLLSDKTFIRRMENLLMVTEKSSGRGTSDWLIP